MLFPAKKGACSILNANEVHRARNEPKAIPARKEEIRNWGYSITNENKDFIRSLYLPLKLHGMSGSTRMMMMTHITIIPAATKKMNRHPKYSPIIPLTTREARIPVSNPDNHTYIFSLGFGSGKLGSYGDKDLWHHRTNAGQ